MKCGLLGRRLGHSYSPQIHAFLGNYSYDLYEREPDRLVSFLEEEELTGFNVTIPYKKDIIPYLDELTPIARELKSVNTVIRREDGTLLGHNTDHYGFRYLVQKSGLSLANKKVLVLGSGGASSTVCAVLRELEANVIIISRSGENNYTNLSLHKDARLIVNTTPVGMYPHTGVSPVSVKEFPKLEGVLDLIYNPARTQLLLDAMEFGIPCANGLWMLVAQAKEAAEYFTGTAIDDRCIPTIYNALSRRMENIVLVGMPGSGKSTVAANLAQILQKKTVDSDDWICSHTGKTIPHIFSTEGEMRFREYETEALAALGKESGCILATGGGCVTLQRNLPLLRQNGRIIWLQRNPEQLPTAGRPLSQATPPEIMYKAREPLYRQFCDVCIDNNGSIDRTVQSILNYLEECL